MDSHSDMDLVELALDGDAGAFEDLFQRHYAAVYGLAYKWCGAKADAEDIAQDVFVKLARKLRSFGSRASFKTWLYRITINAAKDFSRKSARRRTYESEFVREQRSSNPSAGFQDEPDSEHLPTAIDKLPQKQKTAILLVLGEGMTHKEASIIMHCSETTVSWRIFQARKRLKKSLAQEI